MSTARLHLLLVLGTLTTGACAAYLARAGGDTIRFSHGVHTRAKVECLACHEPIYDAKELGGSFLPKERKCLECHEEKKTGGQCAFCHSDVRRAGPFVRPEPQLRMGHAAHIERVKEDCARCHAQLPEPGQAAAKPTMAACPGCHEHKQEYKAGRCEGCHLDLGRYPLRPIPMFTHQGDYLARHGREARAAERTCATCHEQTFCADCHAATVATRIELKLPERVDRSFIHRGDYVGRHSVEARVDPVSCRRCHGTSYCESCHAAQRLSGSAADPLSPHPAGWSVAGTPQFHGAAARRDIASCASCHEQGPRSNCVDCHRVGGVGGNPHPQTWLERHDRQEIARNGMCRYCHP